MRGYRRYFIPVLAALAYVAVVRWRGARPGTAPHGRDAADPGAAVFAHVTLPVWDPPGTTVPIRYPVRLEDPRGDEAARRGLHTATLIELAAGQEETHRTLMASLHEYAVKMRAETAAALAPHRNNPIMEPSYMRAALKEAKRPITLEETRASLRLHEVVLFDRRRDGHPYVGFRFSWDYDPEHGIGALLRGERVAAVGPDVSFSSMEADWDGAETF